MELVEFFIGTTSKEDGTPLTTCLKLEPLCWAWTCMKLCVEWMKYACMEYKTALNYILFLIALLIVHRSFVWYRNGIAIARYRQDLAAIRNAELELQQQDQITQRNNEKREAKIPKKKDYRHNQPWGEHRFQECLEEPKQTVEQATTCLEIITAVPEKTIELMNNTINNNQNESQHEEESVNQLKSILKNKKQPPLPQTVEDRKLLTISKNFNAAMNKITLEIVKEEETNKDHANCKPKLGKSLPLPEYPKARPKKISNEIPKDQANCIPKLGRILPLSEAPKIGLKKISFKSEAGDSLIDNKPRNISRNRSNQRTRNESLSKPQARTPFTKQSTRTASVQSRSTQVNSKPAYPTNAVVNKVTKTKVIKSTRLQFK